ncbi:MAG: hypothetical protein RIF34_05830 [Candidatus Kapaibacterium sp.]
MDPPIYKSEEWYSIKFSDDEYHVENKNNKLIVINAVRSNEVKLSLLDGKLIGIDEGEWGGQLNFLPADSTKLPFEVKNGNINHLFSYKEEIYLIDGLSHMGYDKGALYKLNLFKDTITYDLVEEFDSNPKAFTIYNEKYYIISNKYFIVIDNQKKDTIIDGSYWKELDPNSIAVFDDNNIFIGMKGAFAKVNKNDKTIKFYRKKKNIATTH